MYYYGIMLIISVHFHCIFIIIKKPMLELHKHIIR